MGKPKVGDHITCKIAQEAYYSNYDGNPVMVFEPGMVGVVASLPPKVRITKGPGKDGCDHFAAVDYDCPVTGKKQRVGLNFCNIKKVKA